MVLFKGLVIRYSFISLIVLISCLSSLSSCSRNKQSQPVSSFLVDPTFTGTVEVLLGDGPNSFVYTIRLSDGSISPATEVGEDTFKRTFKPTGANLPEMVHAPNAEYWATNDGNGITVIDRRGDQVARFRLDPKERVTGIAWAPDSTALAVLFQVDRSVFLSGRGILGLISGHPSVLTTFEVMLCSPLTQKVKQAASHQKRCGRWLGRG